MAIDLKIPISQFGRVLRKVKLIEWLVILAIIAIVVSLVIPRPKWGASGDIEIPVEVLVFDAEHMRPIAEARVGMFWAIGPDSSKKLTDQLEQFNQPWRDERYPRGGVTRSDGKATIPVEFHTSSSYKHPESRAHLTGWWIAVDAPGYGAVAVPVRYQSQPSEALKKQRKLEAFVGLWPARSESAGSLQ